MKNEAFEGEGVGFYRCMVCATVNSPWELKKLGSCRKCGATKVKATNLSFWEKVVQIVRRPMLWKWSDV